MLRAAVRSSMLLSMLLTKAKRLAPVAQVTQEAQVALFSGASVPRCPSRSLDVRGAFGISGAGPHQRRRNSQLATLLSHRCRCSACGLLSYDECRKRSQASWPVALALVPPGVLLCTAHMHREAWIIARRQFTPTGHRVQRAHVAVSSGGMPCFALPLCTTVITVRRTTCG